MNAITKCAAASIAGLVLVPSIAWASERLGLTAQNIVMGCCLILIMLCAGRFAYLWAEDAKTRAVKAADEAVALRSVEWQA